jgi:hypothetical protein
MVSAVDKKHVQIVYLGLQEQRDRGACRRLESYTLLFLVGLTLW